MELPADLDTYLREREGSVPDLRPGTEKLIVWADPRRRDRAPWSLVYVHGFSASRQETRPLAEIVASRLGANLFYARLAGHGQSEEALGRAGVRDWLADAEEALAIGRRLGERTAVIGNSTGATLALWAALHRALPRPDALVLLSPNFGPRQQLAGRLLTWPGKRWIARLAIGRYRSVEPRTEGHRRYWTTRYPVRALIEMMALVASVRKADLSLLRMPTLSIYSPKDSVLSVPRLRASLERLGAAPHRILTVDEPDDPAGHLLAGDILSPSTTAPVAAAIGNFLVTL